MIKECLLFRYNREQCPEHCSTTRSLVEQSGGRSSILTRIIHYTEMENSSNQQQNLSSPKTRDLNVEFRSSRRNLLDDFPVLTVSRLCNLDDPSFDRFEKEWENEYLEAAYKPFNLIFLCSVFGILRLLQGVKHCFGMPDGANGNTSWRISTWISSVACGILLLVIASLLSVASGPIRRFCSKHYDIMCSFVLLLLFFTVGFPRAMVAKYEEVCFKTTNNLIFFGSSRFQDYFQCASVLTVIQ